jgi:hypothetical protein
MTANPISNDSDYDTPDSVQNDESLRGAGTDYNNDGGVDNDIVNDDRVDNNISAQDQSVGTPAEPVLTEDEFDRVTTEEE